jgi:hypothetical protein
MPYLIVTSVIYLVMAVWDRQKAWWLAAPYLLAATASGVTIGKDGSNVNYLFEFSSALALMAGLFIAWPGAAWQGKTWVGKHWCHKVILMVLLLFQVNELHAWSLKDYYKWATDRALHEKKQISEMTDLIKKADGPVLADEFMGLIPLAGKALVFQPFEYKQLVIGKTWDQQPFLDDIINQKFGLIMLYDTPGWDSRGARWTPEQLEAIYSHYVIKTRLANTRIYVPLDKDIFKK